jgi:ubiquinone/menaquinone biosynthesis C-methylase UbiE
MSEGAPDPATSFGAFAGAYDALRPSWPASTATWLVGEPGQGISVLDLGAGTGKLTTTLTGLGHRVIAVDPAEGMLAELTRALPGVTARVGSAEAIPAGDSSVDAVTVAQAWHWFDPQLAAAECARVLRPGGVLGVAWHSRDESVPWVHELARTVGRMEDIGRRPRAGAPELSQEFSPIEEAVFGYALTTTPEGLRALADTWSYVHLAADRTAKLDAVLAIGRRAAAADGTLVVPHLTRCYRARRRGGA